MKKSLLLGMLGLVTMTSSFGQGFIALDTYATYGPLITYGANIPANGVSGALGSGGLNGSWTAGFYFALGDIGLVDPSSSGIPNAALSLATGPGSSAVFQDTAFGVAGEFEAPYRFNTGAAPGPVTLELVVYPTVAGSYAAALYRAHSAPFVMTTVSIVSTPPSYVGNYLSGFGIIWIPEPGPLVLASLAGLVLWLFRRKKI